MKQSIQALTNLSDINFDDFFSISVYRNEIVFIGYLTKAKLDRYKASGFEFILTFNDMLASSKIIDDVKITIHLHIND